MRLYLEEKAQAKARPRLGKYGVYDDQHSKKHADKWTFALQMRKKGILKLAKQPLRMQLISYVPFPRSWSTAKKKAFLGKPCIKTPDVDNSVKYYCDVLNKIAYEDDSHIAQLWAEKLYWHTAGIEINLTPIGEIMIHEHAKTVKGEITVADVEYMVKKAHRIGLSGRQLSHVYTQEDGEGRHFYFECQGIQEVTLPERDEGL